MVEAEILYSLDQYRNSSVLLDGRIVSGDVYVWTYPDSDLTQVDFYLDDSSMSGSPMRTERIVPFDFEGTVSDGTANEFDTTGLSDGEHTITVRVAHTNGVIYVKHAVFTVDNAPVVEGPLPPGEPTPTPTPAPAPTSTPAPAPGSDSINVTDLEVDSWRVRGRSRWGAEVEVSVVNSVGAPVAGVVVVGRFQQESWVSGDRTCRTDGSGQCTLTQPSFPSSSRWASFTVRDLRHSLLDYESTQNSDIDGDSDGTRIDFRKP